MLRIDLRYVKDGMELALPVYNPHAPQQILLRVGYALNHEIIRKLQEHRIRDVWVRYPSLDFLSKYVDTATIQAQADIVGQIANTFEQVQGESNARLRYDEYTRSIGKLIDHMISNPSAAIFLGDISSDSDDLMRHSSAVTYLALLMGMKLEGYIVRERRHVDPVRAKELANLGLGAMLHDIGMTQIADEAREHHEKTGDESDLQYREHTALGYQMVRGQVDPTAANVILHHHQRFDGAGWTGANYPVLEGKRIHIFSRITALADQFDRMRHPMGLPKQPTVWVLSALLAQPLADHFDPRVISALLTVTPPYPPGSIVKLSDGQHAVCVEHHPEHPCRPTVQIIPDPATLEPGDESPPGPMMDLSLAHPELMITETDGMDVSEFNFNLPSSIGTPQPIAAWL